MGEQVREPLLRHFGRRNIGREVVLLRDRLESPVTNRPASIAVGGRSSSQDDLHPSAPRARGFHRFNLQFSPCRPWHGVVTRTAPSRCPPAPPCTPTGSSRPFSWRP